MQRIQTVILLMVQKSQTTTWDGAKTCRKWWAFNYHINWWVYRISAINSIWVVSNIFYFHPYLGKISHLTCAYFSDGLVQPPTRYEDNSTLKTPCQNLASTAMVFPSPTASPAWRKRKRTQKQAWQILPSFTQFLKGRRSLLDTWIYS